MYNKKPDVVIVENRSNGGGQISTIHCAIELGVNFLDTADIYGLGVNEELVGKALKGKRNVEI